MSPILDADMDSLFRDGIPIDKEKRAKRAEHLKEHPEDRLRVDKTPLRKIIPYLAFICGVGSSASIHRDQAMKGSDIDGGVVITSWPCSDKEIQLFVDELRLQGFDVYSPQDAARARQELEDKRPGFANLSFQEKIKEIDEHTQRITHAESQIIKFMSVAEHAHENRRTEDEVRKMESNVVGA